MNINMELLIWLPPLLFILHDMEEIIGVTAWKEREPEMKKYLSVKFIPFGTAKDTAGFSACVYEELLILTVISLFSFVTGHCGLWFGITAAHTIHLILFHIIGGSLVYRAYAPGFMTACLTAIPCIWVLSAAEEILRYSPPQMLERIFIGMIIAMANLHVLHQSAGKIGDWIENGRNMRHV